MSARHLTPNCGTRGRLGCTGRGAAAGLALKGLMETHQQRDRGVPELGWPQVSQVLHSPPTPADPAQSLGTNPVGARGGGWEAHLAIKRSPTEQRCFCLLLIWTSPFAYGKHPWREAVTAEPWAPAHPELPYISLPSRGTRPFLSLPSLRLQALLLPADEKP